MKYKKVVLLYLAGFIATIVMITFCFQFKIGFQHVNTGENVQDILKLFSLEVYTITYIPIPSNSGNIRHQVTDSFSFGNFFLLTIINTAIIYTLRLIYKFLSR